MKRHWLAGKRYWLAGAALLIILAGGLPAALLTSSAPAVPGDTPSAIEAALMARGVSADLVAITETKDGEVLVRITSRVGGDPSSVWARAIVEREMNRLKAAGLTAAEWVTIEIVDEKGGPVLKTRQPVEAAPVLDSPTFDESRVAQLSSAIEGLAQKGGLEAEVAAAPGDPGTIGVTLRTDGGRDRDAQIYWIVRTLLGDIRHEAEQKQNLNVAFYRLSIVDGNSGEPLVEYVVDAVESSVRAWMADGVRPVWSDFEPVTGAEDDDGGNP